MAGNGGELGKQLGMWGVFAVAAGSMISSGLFVLPGLAFAEVGPAMILAYALAGLLCIPTMLSQAELATAMPRSAGSYYFVERSLGGLLGTVAGLINWCAIGYKAAFALLGLGTLVALILPDAGIWTIKGTAIGACILFTGLNCLSVKGVGRIQGLLVLALIAILLVYALAAAPGLAPQRYTPFLTADWQGFLAVTGMVFVSFGGLTKVVDVAEEVRDPARNLPRGMFLAFTVVLTLYVGVALVTVGVLDGPRLAGSLRPITDGAEAVLGPIGAILMGIGALLAYATTGNAGILSASRSPMAMSRDGLLPAFFARTSRRFGTPHIAVLTTGLLMSLVIALLSVEDLVKTASTMLLISLTLVNIAVLVMRRARIEGYRPTYLAPLHPWRPLVAIVLYVFLIAEMGTVPLLITGGFIAAASLWYLVYVQHRIQRESAVVFMVKSILSRQIGRSGIEDELVHLSLARDEIETDRLDELVRRAPVLDIPQRIDIHELFTRVAGAMSPNLGLEPERIRQLLLAREAESNTVISPGLAVPHIVVEGDGVFEVALVRCREGAVFDELHPPVHIAFVLIGSADERNFHLRVLMAIAHIVQAEDFQKRWNQAANAEQLRDIILLSKRQR